MENEHSKISPVETYKQIIDQLVELSPSLGARLIAEEGIYSNAIELSPLNDFVQKLHTDERTLLSEICTQERISAIHDVLAMLTWWIDCQDLALTSKGTPIPVQLSGMGLHGDYIGRMDGWEWPSDLAHH